MHNDVWVFLNSRRCKYRHAAMSKPHKNKSSRKRCVFNQHNVLQASSETAWFLTWGNNQTLGAWLFAARVCFFRCRTFTLLYFFWTFICVFWIGIVLEAACPLIDLVGHRRLLLWTEVHCAQGKAHLSLNSTPVPPVTFSLSQFSLQALERDSCTSKGAVQRERERERERGDREGREKERPSENSGCI